MNRVYLPQKKFWGFLMAFSPHQTSAIEYHPSTCSDIVMTRVKHRPTLGKMQVALAGKARSW